MWNVQRVIKMFSRIPGQAVTLNQSLNWWWWWGRCRVIIYEILIEAENVKGPVSSLALPLCYSGGFEVR